jgi:hypothetical protein
MIIKTYDDYLALRVKFGLTTVEFNKLMGVNAHLKYMWKHKEEIEKVYQILATAIDENFAMVKDCIDNPDIVTVEEFFAFKDRIVSQYGLDSFLKLFGRINIMSVYRWKNRKSIRQIYFNIANVANKDYMFVSNIADRVMM